MDDDDTQSLWERRFTFGNDKLEVILEEDFGGESGLGGTVWEAAATIANTIDSWICDDKLHPNLEIWKGKCILELGSGCGLLAILAWKLGADVFATDMQQVLEVLENNIKKNSIPYELVFDGSFRTHTRFHLTDMVWDSAKTYKQNLWPVFDIILAAECLYHENAVEPLLNTVYQLSSENTVTYLCGVIGVQTLRKFFETVGQKFIVTEYGSQTSIDNVNVKMLEDNDPNHKVSSRKVYVLKKKK